MRSDRWVDDITADEWDKILRPNKYTTASLSSTAEPAPSSGASGRSEEEYPTYRQRDVRASFMSGLLIGFLYGVASTTVLIFIVWRLTD